MAHSALRFVRSDVAAHFIKFCAVGGVGFAINAGLLVFLHDHIQLPFYAAQLVGAETALLTNFLLHDYWTFSNTTPLRSRRNRLAVYHGMFLLGMAVNSGVTIAVHYLWDVPSLFALALGSAAALLVNFLTSRWLVWGNRSLCAKQ